MRRGNLFWGVILILLGGLFLLQANGIITDVLGWFWPLGLILLGIWVLSSRLLPRHSGQGDTFTIDLQGAKHLDLDVDHGGGFVSIKGGAPAGVALCGSEAFGLEYKAHINGDGLGIDIDAGPTFFPFLGPEEGEWRFNLTQEVPVAIKLDSGASSLDLDFSDVKLTFLGVDTGASRVKLILPANAGHTLVDFEAGAASLEVVVPEMVAARIRLDQGVSSTSIDENRFPKIEYTSNLYQSAGFDSAENKVEFHFEGGASSLTVR